MPNFMPNNFSHVVFTRATVTFFGKVRSFEPLPSRVSVSSSDIDELTPSFLVPLSDSLDSSCCCDCVVFVVCTPANAAQTAVTLPATPCQDRLACAQNFAKASSRKFSPQQAPGGSRTRATQATIPSPPTEIHNSAFPDERLMNFVSKPVFTVPDFPTRSLK